MAMYGLRYPKLGVEKFYLERAKSGLCSTEAEYCKKIEGESLDKYLRLYSEYLLKTVSGSNL